MLKLSSTFQPRAVNSLRARVDIWPKGRQSLMYGVPADLNLERFVYLRALVAYRIRDAIRLVHNLLRAGQELAIDAEKNWPTLL